MKLVIFDLDNTLFDTDALNNSHAGIETITPFPDAVFVLDTPGFEKVCVTRDKYPGNDMQIKKLKILGIFDKFSDVRVCLEDTEKKGLFEQIIAERRIQPHDVIVVGDRIDSEIRFGNELGCVTVLMKHGKYQKLTPRNSFDHPKHTITSLSDILPLIKQ